ncbi:hypothetical protein CKAH01_00631 [Colletotrichum kahawae]|uniref:Uncharacterized protein n=1 Tax=Colletotrichum kahawae TaxID=34407 RepID=A0AAD9YKU2_COLKA|nr:hypothetical protein CKAH01_00631 [Colletotrichum kahawae]
MVYGTFTINRVYLDGLSTAIVLPADVFLCGIMGGSGLDDRLEVMDAWKGDQPSKTNIDIEKNRLRCTG